MTSEQTVTRENDLPVSTEVVVDSHEQERPDIGPSRMARRTLVAAVQIGLLTVVLLAWEFLPKIESLSSRSRLLDPFFISSPSEIASRLAELLWGDASAVGLPRLVWNTVSSSVIGLIAGCAIGMGVGMLLGSVQFLSDVFRPFIVVLNTIPKITLIPIILLLFGPTSTSAILVATMTVFIVTFFNAYTGSKSLPPVLVQNATLLGATSLQIARRVRFRYIVAWTLSVLPLAATYSVISVITAEVLIGMDGVGKLLSTATATADSTLVFSVVVVLAAIGCLIVGLATLVTRRYLHWWAK